MTRLNTIPSKQTPKKREIEESEEDEVEPIFSKKPKSSKDEESEEEEVDPVSEESEESEAESGPRSTQVTEDRYQHLKQLLTNNPKEEFIAIDALRDADNGDPIGKIVLPTSILTSEVEKHMFEKWRKLGYLHAEQHTKNCGLFDFLAWRITYNINGYEFADDWKKGQPPRLEIPQLIQINGISYDAMSPKDCGKWERYELALQDLKHSLDIPIKETFVVNFVE